MVKPATFDYAAQWDEPDPEELTLPSGKKVLVRMPDLLVMAKAGLIPDALSPIVESFIFDKEGTIAKINDTNKPPGSRLADYSQYMKYVDVLVVGACVAPVVRFAPKAGELHPDQIATPDRIAIWQWAEGLPTALAAFLAGGEGQDAGVPSLADGEEPESAPERDDRPHVAA